MAPGLMDGFLLDDGRSERKNELPTADPQLSPMAQDHMTSAVRARSDQVAASWQRTVILWL